MHHLPLAPTGYQNSRLLELPVPNAREDSLHDATPCRHTHSLHMRQITSKAGCTAVYGLSRAYDHAQPQPRRKRLIASP